ncbi:hypothetical protein [Halegenticoccus soli]|uniref:hypothetical protein n=1 Tax=Halegenticoccus soli TaxID=1985678 RepID=UPI000C6DA946|nr:hypothetical protein [Halegenticoccus soli]
MSSPPPDDWDREDERTDRSERSGHRSDQSDYRPDRATRAAESADSIDSTDSVESTERARATPDEGTGRADPRERERESGGLDRYLPDATVDSRWWYWIAAVPAYFVVTFLAAVGAFALFGLGFALDLAGLGGLASIGSFFAVAFAALLLGLAGVVIAVLFPIAIYVDARAVSRARLEWDPDPALYGLVALAAVIVTNFVVSVPLAVYYLYLRHKHVGTP